jgi:hypothetical protein
MGGVGRRHISESSVIGFFVCVIVLVTLNQYTQSWEIREEILVQK